MPLDLASLLRRTARVAVTFDGETFGVDYLPHVITADVQADLQATLERVGEDQTAAIASLFTLLSTVVGGWEIEEDGQPLAVSEDALRRFPLALLAAIANAITADMSDPNRTTTTGADETRSSSGSSRLARLALAQTGTG
jgi:hypothetical protein